MLCPLHGHHLCILRLRPCLRGSKSRFVDEPHLLPGFCVLSTFPGEATLVTPSRDSSDLRSVLLFHHKHSLRRTGQAGEGPSPSARCQHLWWEVETTPWSPWLPPLEFLLGRVRSSSACPMGPRHAHCAALVWGSASLFRGEPGPLQAALPFLGKGGG